MTSDGAQSILVASLRAVAAAADDLTRCPNVDAICRRAVEFARDQLGLERCSIYLGGDDVLQGSYGTDLYRQTTDERSNTVPVTDLWRERIQSLSPLGIGWTVLDNGPYHEWEGGQETIIGHGWVALTPIHSAKKLIGIFFNDTAISREPLNPVDQEVVSVFCSLLGNVIERKRAEIALAEERNLLRTLIDSLPDFIFVKDTNMRFGLANMAVARLVGVDSPDLLVGKSNYDLFPPDLADFYRADDVAVMESGQILANREEITLDRRGQQIWVLTTKVPLRSQEGKIIGLIGVSRDITDLKQAQDGLKKSHDNLELRIQERIAELKQANLALQAEMVERKQAEEQLRQSEERFAKAFHASPIAINIVTLADGICLDANARFLEFMGYTREEIIGKPILEMYALMTGGHEALILDMMRQQKVIRNFEITVMTRSGEPRVAQISLETIDLDGVECVLSMLQDITERKRIEKVLVEERTLLRTLIDTLPDYIFIKDVSGRFMISNLAHARAVGIQNPDDFIGKTAAELFPSELAVQYDADDQEVLQQGQSLINVERVTLDDSGQLINVATTKVPLRDAQGRVVGLVGISRDITPYKQAQAALKQQELFLRQVIDANPNLIFVKDAEGRFVLVNKAHAAMNGLNVREMIGKRDTDLNIPPDEAERFLQDDREVMTTLHLKEIPEEPLTDLSTGETRWLRTIKVPLISPENQQPSVLGVAIDITNQKRAELALQASEERYRTVTELISDYAFSYLVNPDGTIENEWGTMVSFMRLAGYHPSDIGSSLKLYHPDDNAAVAEQLKLVVNGQATDQECRIITKSGETRWLHLRRKPVWDDTQQRVVRFYGVAQDITERKAAEEALQKAHIELEERVIVRTAALSRANRLLKQEISEREQAQEALATERNLLRVLVDNLPHAIYVKDTEARFVIANHSLMRTFGAKSAEDVVGKNDFDFHPQAAAEKFYENDMQVIQTGQPLVGREEVAADEHGQLIWLLTSKFPLFNSRGEVTGLVGMGLDITERKRAEETLLQAHNELELRVEERTAELRTANEEVKRFAYIVSHDLRAPLVNIKGFSSELQSALATIQTVIEPCRAAMAETQRAALKQALEEDVPEALGFISASVERMNYLINAILKLSRLGQRQIQIEQVNTFELVQALVKSLGHQIAQQKAEVVIAALPNVAADYTVMEQILGNIVTNAVLYLDPTRPGHIEISGARSARETVFQVRDNGRGIAEEDRGKVFELFRRAGNPGVPGEGMGLAYVKALLRLHEGRIWFESQLGVGTTFFFSIPHQQENSARA